MRFQKKTGAVDFINPNDIGVLCSLFGLEGALCRLLDLVPNAIKKIASLDPSVGNADKVFGDILKNVAKKSYTLVIEEFTGKINVEQFCRSEPPSQPEDITYQDVFIFIAELVPILSKFFTANEVLTGENTRILDKIVATWLRKQWFLNCECKRCEEPPPNTPPQNVYPPYNPSFCPDGSVRCKNLRLATPDPNGIYDGKGGKVKTTFSCYGFFEVTYVDEYYYEYYDEYYDDQSRRSVLHRITSKVMFPLEDVDSVKNSVPVRSGISFFYKTEIFYEPYSRNYVSGGIPSPLFLDDGSGYKPVSPDNAQGGSFSPCYQPPPPPPPPEFCNLFPDDPLCCVYGCTDSTALNYDPLATCDDGSCTYGDCDRINVTIQEFAGCDLPRISGTRQLFDSGKIQQITIQEFAGCGLPRISGIRQLYICSEAIEDVYGCTDPYANNYNSDATIDDGSCRYVIYGCTDGNALNHNPDAIIDDGSCIY